MTRLVFAGIIFIESLCGQMLGGQAVAQSATSDTIRLTIAEARTRAFHANPELLAARMDSVVARGRLRQARTFRFNPSADVVARPSGDELEAAVSQEIEVFGQRSTRIAAGRAGLERAEASAMDATRLVIGEVERTFYRLASATQRAKLSDEIVARNARLADVARRQLAEGEISRIDYNLAVVEHGRARARSLATRREQEASAIELGRLLGLPRESPVAAVPDSLPTFAADSGHGVPRAPGPKDSALTLDIEVLTAHALRRRPDLAERAAAVRQTEAEISLTRREALPNPVLRGVLEQPTRGGPRTLRPGIGLTLPFLNRRQGDLQALRAAARRAELERTALVARVRADVASALASYKSASTEVQMLETTVLAAARQNRLLVENAYREGEVGLPVLLLIQNQAIDAELDYWTAWLASREALANLAEATAQNIEGLQGIDMGARR